MSSDQIRALIALTGILVLLLATLTFAVWKFLATSRATRRRASGSGAEQAFLAATLQDTLTRLRSSEQAMSVRATASENLSAQIVASLDAGVLVVDASGVVRTLNPAGQRLLGIDAPAGESYRSLLARAHAAPLADLIDASLRTGQPLTRRTLALPQAAHITSVGVTVSVLKNAHDHGAICLFTDLSDIVRLEKQLRLKEALAGLGELTAGIAHEFRNGLATIHGYSRLMQPERLPDAYRPYVQGIRDEAEALGGVVTNFLSFAKPDQLVLSRVDVGAIVARAIDEMRQDLAEANVTIRGPFGAILGDEVLLRQLVLNLVRNAVEASAHAGRQPSVLVDGEVLHDGGCALTVHDNGPGIPQEQREQIFRPFFTTKASGTGLGLAIVQKIAVTHNGHVLVGQSDALGGATVRVTLPAGDVRAADPAA